MGKSTKKIFIICLFFLIIIASVTAYTIRGNMLKEEGYKRIKENSFLTETKPVRPASFYSGKVAYAYQLASEIPELVDKQFCYCYCRKNHGHKTLLTCFTNDHGAECAICINEVIMANDLLKKGYDADQITETIDDVFSEIARKARPQHF